MRKYLLFILPIFLLTIFFIGLVPAQAQYGLAETANRAGYKAGETPYSVTTTIINVALGLVYVIFFILIVYSGFRWMTAQGNEENATKAKNILEAAIIGVIIISAAYAITNFILGKVGADKVETPPPTDPAAIVDKCANVTCATGEICNTATGACVVSP